MGRPDLLAEHAALVRELDGLRELCEREYASMSVQVARLRADRMVRVAERMKAIEGTKTWKRSHAPVLPAAVQMRIDDDG